MSQRDRIILYDIVSYHILSQAQNNPNSHKENNPTKEGTTGNDDGDGSAKEKGGKGNQEKLSYLRSQKKDREETREERKAKTLPEIQNRRDTCRHFCNYCHEPPEFNCLGCQNALCENCFAVSSEFTVVRGVQSLCIDCLEIVKIIEQNLNHDSEGNKISLDDRETYECLFKEYWEIVKEKEGLTGEDISAAQLNCQKATNFMHQKNLKIAKVKEGLTSEDISAAQPNYKRGKKFMHHKSSSEDEEEKLNDSMSSDSDEGYKPPKRKRYNLEKFVGWGSKPLISFLASIGKDETEPLTQWSVTSLIHEYIKEKNLHDPKYRGKFLPDEKLFPIFRKKVVSKSQIYSLLKCHFAKKLDDSSSEKNDKQIKNSSSDKHVNDRPKCMKSRLSSLIGKSVLRKGDFFIKSSHFASMSVNNINLIYLKRSLVLEFSKQPETFMNKVVGTFVRAKVDSSDSKQRKSHHLVRVVGVVFSEMSNGTLLQVSFMTKAIPISDLSDEDFTEQECEDLQQKVKANLLPKLTVVEVEEKARSLHVDITKHVCISYSMLNEHLFLFHYWFKISDQYLD
uniref:Uncharacterized protein At5g08430 family n=1 Tax=Cajanus cajan TaxID=3821 RepID=A0A151RJW0_CAJCA|nr:Uncharacterized protein At5g08430 family [Cajanus cajan]